MIGPVAGKRRPLRRAVWARVLSSHTTSDEVVTHGSRAIPVLRAGIQSKAAAVGPFLALLNTTSDSPFLNYAVPVDNSGPGRTSRNGTMADARLAVR